MKHKIITDVSDFLNKYGIKNKTVLIAFSGGFDSMCLLDIINNLKTEFNLTPIAIHLNHNWRGEESDREELNCKEFCQEHCITFFSKKLSDNIKKTENEARIARYNFFEECAQNFKTDIVFTAHNADDNAETLLYRIAKGTGLEGLKCIAPKRDIYYRPLLNTYREDIENYCNAQKLSPNSDSSNQNTKYKRNLIRQKILPEFININKETKKALNNLCKIATLESDIVQEYLNSIQDKFNTSNFLSFSNALQYRIIYQLLTDNNFETDIKTVENLLEFIKKNANSKCGKTKSINKEYFIFCSSENIRLIKINKNITNECINLTKSNKVFTKECIFTITECQKAPVKFPKDDEMTAYVDLSNVDFPLQLRNRLDGDIISPLGLKGSQKLKKYLNNKGIPKDERDKMLFLCKDKEVLWVPKFGISDKIKVTTKPTHMIKMEKING